MARAFNKGRDTKGPGAIDIHIKTLRNRTIEKKKKNEQRTSCKQRQTGRQRRRMAKAESVRDGTNGPHP